MLLQSSLFSEIRGIDQREIVSARYSRKSSALIAIQETLLYVSTRHRQKFHRGECLSIPSR